MSRTAILTRPGDRHAALSVRLHAAGWTVLSAPALAITPLPVPDIARFAPSNFDLIIFVSGHAVRAYAQALATQPGQRPVWPTHVAVAGVGMATLRAARLAFVRSGEVLEYAPALDAPSYDSESLYTAMQAAGAAPNRVLIVRGVTGRQWLAERLRADGVHVETLALYARQPALWSARTLDALHAWRAEGRAATWLFTSGEGLAAVVQQIHANGLADWCSGSSAVVTHPRLAPVWREALATTAGSEHRVKICLPDDDGIFEAFVAV